MMEGLAAEAAAPKTVMIDATYLKAHRMATSLRSKKGAGRSEGPFDWSNQRRIGCWPTAASRPTGSEMR